MFVVVFLISVGFLATTTAVCPTNEKLNDCADECEPTCQYQKSLVCFKNKRCICQPGLLRDLNSGNCVAPDCCPKECGLNEEWSVCTKYKCTKSCRRHSPDRHCSCVPGCQCASGYIWDERRSKCVQRHTCSRRCGENQEWRDCSDEHCRATCQKTYLKWCSQTCEPGCSCIDGYIWDEHYRKCVRRGHCSRVCGRNAKWVEDIPDRVPTCRSYRQPRLPHGVIRPRQSGCICERGYVLEEYSQRCVRPQQCRNNRG